jgi:hypothetical protein
MRKGILDTNQPEELEPGYVDQLVATLANGLKAKHISIRNIGYWGHHFKALLKQNYKAEVERVLKWYVAHVGEEFVPEAYSGSAFRKKFKQIQKQSKKVSASTVVVGEVAKGIAGRLAKKDWMGLSKDCLAVIVQQSMDNHVLFARKVQDCKTANPKLARLLDHLKACSLIHSTHFVEHVWMVDMHGLWKWCADNGSSLPPTALVFDYKSAKFQVIMYRVLYDWCHDPGRWDLLLKEMEK